jgi:hypothetical protein
MNGGARSCRFFADAFSIAISWLQDAIGLMSVCPTRMLAILALGLVLAMARAHAQTPLPAQARPAKPADIIQRACVFGRCTAHRFRKPARDAFAWKAFSVQEIAFHSPKGNATNLHFALVGVLRSAPAVTVRAHSIKSLSARQRGGTIIAATFRCGRFHKNWSHVTRATIIDADGEHSNSVDFTGEL